MANDALLTLPALTASATSDAENLGIAALTLPALACEASASGVVLPALEVSATGLSGEVGEASLTLPALVGYGEVPQALLTLPALECSGEAPTQALVTLPALEMAADAVVGTLGQSSITLPALSLDASGDTPLVGTAALTLPLAVVSGAATTGVIGAASVTLASLALAAEGAAGTIGTATLTLPVLSVEASGYGEAVGTATLTLPSLTLTAQGGQARSSTYSAYALQTERRALTTYSNLPIRGLTAFNGVYLAAGPGGLFVLGGNTDAGALISATARLANTDFGSAQLKRVEQMFVNYRTDGDLTLKVITDEHEAYDYTLPAAGHATLAAGRTKIGRGAKGVYWQMELSNRDGADFEFDRITVDPQALSRKLG